MFYSIRKHNYNLKTTNGKSMIPRMTEDHLFVHKLSPQHFKSKFLKYMGVFLVVSGCSPVNLKEYVQMSLVAETSTEDIL